MRESEINTADLAGAEARREQLQIFCALINAQARSANVLTIEQKAKEMWAVAGQIREATLDE
jgi:hypothetical protein